MIDVLGPEKRQTAYHRKRSQLFQRSFEPGMTVSLVARQHGVTASQLFLWRKQYPEGSLTAVAAGEQVVPASELAAALKNSSACSARKRWKMNSSKKPLNMDGQKRIAHALIARGWSKSLVSRCLRVSRAQLHVILRRTDDWMDGRRSRHH